MSPWKRRNIYQPSILRKLTIFFEDTIVSKNKLFHIKHKRPSMIRLHLYLPKDSEQPALFWQNPANIRLSSIQTGHFLLSNTAKNPQDHGIPGKLTNTSRKSTLQCIHPTNGFVSDMFLNDWDILGPNEWITVGFIMSDAKCNNLVKYDFFTLLTIIL